MKSTAAPRRNDPCPCGSGLRFKNCHGNLQIDARLERAQQQRLASDLRGALATLDAALADKPEFPGALNVKGVILRELMDLEGAEKCFRAAIAQSPDFAHAHLNLGIVLLIRGEYPEGWREYEWRTKRPDYNDYADYAFGMPRWKGEPLAGKRILVHAEQGLGDTIQCSRFIEPLAREGAEIDVFCHEPLQPIMQRMRGVRRAFGTLAERPTHDYHAPILDVLIHFLPTIDAPHWLGRYLSALPERVEKWHGLVDRKERPLVGFAWKGNAKQENDWMRSLPTPLAAEISRRARGIRFVNLQFGEPPPEGVSWIDPKPRDWDDTLAIIEHLDLVLTVDTAIAHAAGAMEKPVWVIRGSYPEWRWGREKESTRWYPSMKLMPQHGPGDWSSVVDDVASRLDAV